MRLNKKLPTELMRGKPSGPDGPRPALEGPKQITDLGMEVMAGHLLTAEVGQAVSLEIIAPVTAILSVTVIPNSGDRIKYTVPGIPELIRRDARHHAQLRASVLGVGGHQPTWPGMARSATSGPQARSQSRRRRRPLATCYARPSVCDKLFRHFKVFKLVDFEAVALRD